MRQYCIFFMNFHTDFFGKKKIDVLLHKFNAFSNFFFFFSTACNNLMWNLFPDQGLNPGYNSEGTTS